MSNLVKGIGAEEYHSEVEFDGKDGMRYLVRWGTHPYGNKESGDHKCFQLYIVKRVELPILWLPYDADGAQKHGKN